MSDTSIDCHLGRLRSINRVNSCERIGSLINYNQCPNNPTKLSNSNTNHSSGSDLDGSKQYPCKTMKRLL